MKILLGVPEYPPHHIGGGGEVFKQLAENYRLLGHDVVIAYGDYTSKSIFDQITSWEISKTRFYRIPELPYPKKLPVFRTVMPITPINAHKLRALLKKEQPDVAHIHGYGHWYIDRLARICKAQGIPFIFTNHGNPKIPYMGGPLKKKTWESYKKFRGEYLNEKSSAITCVSEFTKTEYQNSYRGKISVIPNGVVLTNPKFTEADIKNKKDELDLSQDTRVILSVGRVVFYKGYQTIIGALIPGDTKTMYVIVGEDGGYKAQLIEQAKGREVNDQVLFVGKVESGKIDLYYQIADVVAMPSITESFGLVGLEALRNKRHVVFAGTEGLVYLRSSRNTSEIMNNNLSQLLFTEHPHVEENFLGSYKWEGVAQRYEKLFVAACSSTAYLE